MRAGSNFSGVCHRPCAFPALVPHNGDQQNGHHVHTRQRGGPPRAFRTHRRRAQFSKDQNPVAKRIHQIGADHGKQNRLHLVHGLQIAAE